jgi:hypothetical protein
MQLRSKQTRGLLPAVAIAVLGLWACSSGSTDDSVTSGTGTDAGAPPSSDAGAPQTPPPPTDAGTGGGTDGGTKTYACSGSTLGNPGYTCGPYASYSGWSPGYNSGSPIVNQDAWGAIPGETQTLYANSPGDWQVINSTRAGNTAITSYPNAGAFYNEQLVSSFPQITSSWTDVLPTGPGTQGWAAYDLWFNNWANEVMIQHDFIPSSVRCGSYVATNIQFGGSNGVPVHSWNLCLYGSEIIWQSPDNMPSGSVDIKQMITWLENNGHLKANSTVTALSAGFEIASTGGVPEAWKYTSFTMNTGP